VTQGDWFVSSGTAWAFYNVGYDPQIASATQLGVVQIGSNVQVTAGGVISILNADTTQAGVVQLVDDTVTNDSTKALTAAAGFDLQQQIDALNVKNNLTFAGTIDGTTGLMLQVTAEGTAMGFVSGVALPTPSVANEEYFVIVTVPGTFTPPNTGAVTTKDGDWLISNSTQWVYYNVGPDISVASFQQIDDVAALFDGSRVSFPIEIAGVAFTPGNSKNIIINVGGVMQLSGPSFSVSGSTLTFVTAPPADATFAGYVVTNGPIGGTGGGPGSVTSVGTGTGLSGGPIITTGTITLDKATTTTLGGVIADGTTINVSPTGVISAVLPKFVYLDDISGSFNGTTKVFTLREGGVAYSPTPSSNIMVVLGGVPQSPGTSYTVSGSTITFSAAPPASTDFMAVTIA
jgi:hypothetical protein